MKVPGWVTPGYYGRHLAETRWALEATRLAVDPVLVGRGIPRGDGRPVMLMPGFGVGDQTLALLAGWLLGIGYRPKLQGFVINLDCSDRWIERLDRRLVETAELAGRRIALIGHSRGGHYARALAARRPEHVSHAISLGSDLQSILELDLPLKLTVSGISLTLRAAGRTDRSRCLTIGCGCSFAQDYRKPFPVDVVRLTSIYSKSDGVVRWQQQVVPEADCVEVSGSHTGLVFNRKAYRAIARALAKPELALP